MDVVIVVRAVFALGACCRIIAVIAVSVRVLATAIVYASDAVVVNAVSADLSVPGIRGWLGVVAVVGVFGIAAGVSACLEADCRVAVAVEVEVLEPDGDYTDKRVGVITVVGIRYIAIGLLACLGA